MFFIISKFLSPGEYVPVYKSEVKQDQRWSEIRILTSVLCKEEKDRDILINFYLQQGGGSHKFLGASSFNLVQAQ